MLAPILKEDVVSAKSNPKAKWVLSEDKDSQVPAIRRGVQAYVRISAFLTAAQAAKTFTRYLNIKTKDSNLMAPQDVKEGTEIDGKLEKLIKESNNLIVESTSPQEFRARNTFMNVYREKLKSKAD